MRAPSRSLFRSLFAALVLAAGLMSLTGCATGLYHPVWTVDNPTEVQLGRSTVAVMVPGEADRRHSEDAFVQFLQPAFDLTALYVADPKGGAPDTVEAALARARALGFDSLVVARQVEVFEREVFRPRFGVFVGSGYPYGIWGHFPFDPWYEPAYHDTYRRSVVEVSVYTLADERLVWSGKTEMYATDSFADQVEPLADALVRDLVTRGIVR